jgi:hypothetical protein
MRLVLVPLPRAMVPFEVSGGLAERAQAQLATCPRTAGSRNFTRYKRARNQLSFLGSGTNFSTTKTISRS